MKVLVTGHHGYIGSVMAPLLHDAGLTVAGIDTYFYEGCDLVADRIDVPSARGDVRDLSTDALTGFDAVVHLAALSNDPLGDLNPRWTYDVNLNGTVSLARAAKEAGVARFVFASSCSMYGAADVSELVTEEAPLVPLTPYAESKVRAEEALAGLADDDFSPVFMRNATVYGVSPRLRADVVLNNLVGWAFTTGTVKVLSDGQAFNVGADRENYRVSELAEITRDTVRGSTIDYAEGGGPDPRSYRVDFGKFSRTFPEYRPRWTARDGAHELLDAYRRADLNLDTFQGDRFVRIARLKLLIENRDLDDDLRWRQATGAMR
jgi:nucleoside-diphosphate-sugar epimerase